MWLAEEAEQKAERDKLVNEENDQNMNSGHIHVRVMFRSPVMHVFGVSRMCICAFMSRFIFAFMSVFVFVFMSIFTAASTFLSQSMLTLHQA